MPGATPSAAERVLEQLGRHMPASTARFVLGVALRRLGKREDKLGRGDLNPTLVAELESALRMVLPSSEARRDCARSLGALMTGDAPALRQATIQIRTEDAVVDARSQARALAAALGFDNTLQIKIATAVSELARNIQRYAGSGSVLLDPQSTPRRGLKIVARDTGPGIPHLDQVLSGTYKSKTGMGLGLRGCRNLLDDFEVFTSPGLGTTVRAAKWL